MIRHLQQQLIALFVLATSCLSVAQQGDVSPEQYWSDVLREWSTLREEIEGLEGTVRLRETDYIPKRRDLFYTIHFAYDGNHKKIELLKRKGGVYFVASVNPKYGFSARDESKYDGTDSRNTFETSTTFTLADYSSPNESTSDWSVRLHYMYGYMPFHAMCIGQRLLDLEARLGQVLIQSVDTSNQPLIRIAGKIILKGRQGELLTDDFEIFVNRDKRFRIEKGTLKHETYYETVEAEYTDHLGGGYPQVIKGSTYYNEGTKVSDRIIEYDAPQVCKLPKSHFQLEHYGITPPPLDNSEDQASSRWMRALLAVFAFLVGAWALRRLMTN